MARRGHRQKRVVNAVKQLPWQDVANPYSPVEVLSADQVETIVNTALEVLATQGMRFLEPASRKLMQEAGAEVDEAEQIVKFDPDMVREQLRQAPESFELRARNIL